VTADLSIGLVVVAAAVWWCRRYIKSQVRRGRGLWERGVLRVLAVVLRPRRDIVRMRLALHDSLAQTRRVLSHRAAGDGLPSDVKICCRGWSTSRWDWMRSGGSGRRNLTGPSCSIPCPS
jgi:hypothetical protein